MFRDIRVVLLAKEKARVRLQEFFSRFDFGILFFPKAVDALFKVMNFNKTGMQVDIIMLDAEGCDDLNAGDIVKIVRDTGLKSKCMVLTSGIVTEELFEMFERNDFEVFSSSLPAKALDDVFENYLGAKPVYGKNKMFKFTGQPPPKVLSDADISGPSHGVDLNKTLMGLDGEEELLFGLIDSFLASYKETLDLLYMAAQKKDANGLRNVAHKFAGMFASLGAESALRLAVKLEKMGREKNIEEAVFVLYALRLECDNVFASINSFISDGGIINGTKENK